MAPSELAIELQKTASSVKPTIMERKTVTPSVSILNITTQEATPDGASFSDNLLVVEDKAVAKIMVAAIHIPVASTKTSCRVRNQDMRWMLYGRRLCGDSLFSEFKGNEKFWLRACK